MMMYEIIVNITTLNVNIYLLNNIIIYSNNQKREYNSIIE